MVRQLGDMSIGCMLKVIYHRHHQDEVYNVHDCLVYIVHCYRQILRHLCITDSFTVRRYAKRGICRRRVSVCLSVRPSVCVCVRHTPVLYQTVKRIGSRK